MGSVGELAALATAFLWTGSAVSFEAASNRVGSVPVNLLRLLVGFVLLTIWGLIGHGRLLPLEAPADAWVWLAASGFVGFTIGDLCLFRAFVVIGARLSMLLMCLTPPLTALLGTIFLHENLGSLRILGMVMTVGGVAWTVMERRGGGKSTDPKSTADATPQENMAQPRTPSSSRLINTSSTTMAWGITLAVVGALGQAFGLILSKWGMASFEEPFVASQIRVLAGIAGFMVAFTIAGVWKRVFAATRDSRAMALLTSGAVFGPFLGVPLSLLAVHTTEAGVASAIMSIVPILMLPIARLRGEKISARAIVGTMLAVAGVVVLFNG